MKERELPFYVLASLNYYGSATIDELMNRKGLKSNSREDILKALEKNKRDGYAEVDSSGIWSITKSGVIRLSVERD